MLVLNGSSQRGTSAMKTLQVSSGLFGAVIGGFKYQFWGIPVNKKCSENLVVTKK